MKLISPSIRMIDDDRAQLQEDYCVCIPALRAKPARAIIIRKGFVFDGQSVPRLLWRVVGHPFQGKSLAGAMIHDALYQSEELPRPEADVIFRLLIENGRCLSAIKWAAVRAAGWIVWFEHKRDEVAKARNFIDIINLDDWITLEGCQTVTCARLNCPSSGKRFD